MSLSRDQVLHVARLARLELTEAEVGRFSDELSKVFDWVETINELGDMEDVEPTSHVVAVENALRADEPQPSLPQEAALAPGARARDAEAALGGVGRGGQRFGLRQRRRRLVGAQRVLDGDDVRGRLDVLEVAELLDRLDPVEDLRQLIREAAHLVLGQLEAREAGDVEDLVAAEAHAVRS